MGSQSRIKHILFFNSLTHVLPRGSLHGPQTSNSSLFLPLSDIQAQSMGVCRESPPHRFRLLAPLRQTSALPLSPTPQPLHPTPPDMEVLSKTGSCLWVSKAATPKHLSQLCPHPTSLHPPHFQLLFHYFQHRLLCTSKQEKVFSSRVQNVFIQLNVKRKKIDLGVKCYLEAHLHVDSESWSFECFGKYFKKRVKFY